MKKIIAITAVIVPMLLILVLASGCFGQNIAEKIAEEVIEKAIESDSGENVDIDLDDGEMTIESDDGDVSIGMGADLPDNFPDNVPVYPDMEIISSWSVTEDNKDSYSINGLTEDAGSDVFAWYKENLDGWEIENEFSASGDDDKISSLSAKSGGLVVVIMVVETEDEGTSIMESVTEE
jgi:hypothetical protein